MRSCCAVGSASAQGAQVGEGIMTAGRISGANLDSWYAEWTAAADAVYAVGEVADAAGNRVSARQAFFRACTYYRTAGTMLLRVPLDPRLVEANRRQTEAFRRGGALLDVPPEVPASRSRAPPCRDTSSARRTRRRLAPRWC
jgi:hypothetical protein